MTDETETTIGLLKILLTSCCVIFKILLIFLSLFLFMPICPIDRRSYYMLQTLSVLEGYIEELHQAGLLDEEETREMQSQLYK